MSQTSAADQPVLYQTEWCAYSHRVRQVMTELCVTYTCVNVAPSKEARDRLLEATGQDQVPVLVDDGDVIVGSDAIIAHLRRTRTPTPYSTRQAAAGAFRYVKECPTPLDETVARLREILIENRLTTIVDTRLPVSTGEYHLLHVAAPAVTRRIAADDPATVTALTVPIGLWPTASGCGVSVSDPVAGAWMAGRPETLRANRSLRDRVKKVFESL